MNKKMSKREAAERNVNGRYFDSCIPCPHSSSCIGSGLTCSEYCKQYLADNPVDEWQEFLVTAPEYEWKTEVIESGMLIKYRKNPEQTEKSTPMNRISKMLREEGMLLWTNPDGSFQILNPDDEKAEEVAQEKTEPSHEDIMTFWWKHDNGVWFRVIEYDSETTNGLCYCPNTENGEWENRTYFINRESATIPPEKS